jgi:REP element-mobilizing transposase RayT
MPQPEAAVEVNRSWIQETTGEPAPSLIRTGLLEEAPVLRLPIEEAPETFEADLGPLPAGFGQADWVVAEEIPDPEKPLATVDMPTETIALPDLSTTVHLADRLDPLSTEVYNLPFTCVLVPRFPGHYLIGDLAESLSMWYPQICLAYGWRLEGLSVRPEYIQWMVRIPPTTAPDVLLTILRQHTSQRIFEAFPRLRAENSSGEFWAPGYLILSGIQYASATLLADFIRHTRQRQGIGS